MTVQFNVYNRFQFISLILGYNVSFEQNDRPNSLSVFINIEWVNIWRNERNITNDLQHEHEHMHTSMSCVHTSRYVPIKIHIYIELNRIGIKWRPTIQTEPIHTKPKKRDSAVACSKAMRLLLWLEILCIRKLGDAYTLYQLYLLDISTLGCIVIGKMQPFSKLLRSF